MAVPLFLRARCGDLVVVEGEDPGDWWMGHVLHVVGSARGPEPSLFQIACIDSGVVRMVNADQVIERLPFSAVPDDARSPSSPPVSRPERSAGQGSSGGHSGAGAVRLASTAPSSHSATSMRRA